MKNDPEVLALRKDTFLPSNDSVFYHQLIVRFSVGFRNISDSPLIMTHMYLETKSTLEHLTGSTH